tara:strand:+ start:117390 stop:118412 length:1023 start_codon:yes stop_codon:yes gene_type:complete
MNKRSLVENKSLQKEFLHRLSSTLRNFKWKTNGANFSCPICGDSKKNETKARGYIFEKENLYQYFCHNCGFSSNFSFFLKSVNSLLHTEYLKELFLDKKRTDAIMSSVRPKLLPNRISLTYVKAPTIDSLDEGHVAKEYVKRRKIPNKYLKELFYVSTFGNWVRKHYDPNYSGGNDERIIIPFYNGKKQLVAFQGRALSGNTKLRYITIKLSEKAPKIYNFDNVDVKKKIYIVEGPIDAMFLPNAIAVAGSDVTKTLDKLNFDFVFVADREPRNPEIIKKIANMIDRKYKVSLLPESMPGKDINEYILNDYTTNQIVQMIDRFTFEGLQATFQLKMWQKI